MIIVVISVDENFLAFEEKLGSSLVGGAIWIRYPRRNPPLLTWLQPYLLPDLLWVHGLTVTVMPPYLNALVSPVDEADVSVLILIGRLDVVGDFGISLHRLDFLDSEEPFIVVNRLCRVDFIPLNGESRVGVAALHRSCLPGTINPGAIVSFLVRLETIEWACITTVIVPPQFDLFVRVVLEEEVHLLITCRSELVVGDDDLGLSLSERRLGIMSML